MGTSYTIYACLLYTSGQLLMKWDNGRALALIPGEDSFRRLTQEEIDRELQEQAQEQTINEQSM